MDGADTGATGGLIIPGGPGDIGRLNAISDKSSKFYFFQAFSGAMLFLSLQGPMLRPCRPNQAGKPQMSRDKGPAVRAMADGPRNPYIAPSN
jgi:hypothetical protein